ncbi:MAG: 2-dehydropantoate 2-reductase [Desulfurococcaceae archaeon]
MISSEFCVVGAGAVGNALSMYLFAGSSEPPLLIVRSRGTYETLREKRHVRVEAQGREVFVPVEVALPDHHVSCHHIFNAVKAYDVASTIEFMKRSAGPRSSVVMLQNGFGAFEAAAEALPHVNVAAGVVYFGAEKKAVDHVAVHGTCSLVIGSPRGPWPELIGAAEVLRRGGCDVRVVGDVDLYRWLKLAVNAVINPLTAIAKAKNKIVLDERARALVEAIVDEVVEAASASGYLLDRDRLVKHVLDAAAQTADNLSSMAQDVLAGRRTEIDFINGFVAGVLRRRGKEWSVNRVLAELVHLLEAL